MAEQRSFTPNQIVAYNLKRARTLRGWTLDETTERLAPYVGERWTRANLSALERSQAGNRPRRFETHDIIIYGLVFGLSPLWFLMPPPHASKVALHDREGRGLKVDPADFPDDGVESVPLEPGRYLDLLLFRGWVDVHERLEELPPESRGNAREQQAGLLDLYMREALQEQGGLADSLRDLADRLSDAYMAAEARLRRAYTSDDPNAGPTYQDAMKEEK